MEVVVFTNGCFDILHPGHLELLEKAKKLGTKLVVGINSDESVRAIKGYPRPFVTENDRAEVLRGLRFVDEVVIFDEPTPQQIIEKIRPNILVKGGDWSIDQIIGADFVKKNGGQVFSIPLKAGYSTTSIIEKIEGQQSTDNGLRAKDNLIKKGIQEHIEVFENLFENDVPAIENCGIIILKAIEKGNKILVCSDFESEGDAQYLVSEFLRSMKKDWTKVTTTPLKVANTALITINQEEGNQPLLSEQIKILAKKDDVLIAISTGGDSSKVLAAIMQARENSCQTIALTGATGKKLASLCEASVLVPSKQISRIKEAHFSIGKMWCEMIEAKNN